MEPSEQIQQTIFRLRNEINIHLAFGDAEVVNRLRDVIGDLEAQLQQERKGKI